MTHKAAIIKSLLDQAFRVLQHDSDEDQPEYAHLRDALGKSFWKVLKDVPLALPAQTERAMTDEERDAINTALSLIGLSGDPRVRNVHKTLRALLTAAQPASGASND